jgi:hypothetical protein
MKNHAPDDRRLSKALALLDPPPADRDRVAKKIQSVLDDCSGKDHDELDFERNSAGLTRYINALRELKASHAALDPSIHRFLTLGVKYPSRWLGEVSDIEAELREAEIMLEICRRPSGQPTNKRARSAVIWAHVVLEGEGLEVTTERKGKWHRCRRSSPTPAAIYDITSLPNRRLYKEHELRPTTRTLPRPAAKKASRACAACLTGGKPKKDSSLIRCCISYRFYGQHRQ